MGRLSAMLKSLCCASNSTVESTPTSFSSSGNTGNMSGAVVVAVEPTSPSLLSSHQDSLHAFQRTTSYTQALARNVALVDELPQAAKPQVVSVATAQVQIPRSEQTPLLGQGIGMNAPVETKSKPGLIKVGATSAAVMKLVDPFKLYHTEFIEQYLTELDLASGNAITSKLSMAELEYAKTYLEVRKRAVAGFCDKAIGDGIRQVIFLGDGLDPLSIYLASRFSDVKVIGIDANFMDQKQASVNRMGLRNCRYITADVTDVRGCLVGLGRAGYRSGDPVLIIGQGVFMYMEPEVCLAWQRQFFGEGTKYQPNRMVFDVHTPVRHLASAAQRETDALHTSISEKFEESSELKMHREMPYRYLDRDLICLSDVYSWGKLETDIIGLTEYNQKYRESEAQPPARMVYLHPNPNVEELDRY